MKLQLLRNVCSFFFYISHADNRLSIIYTPNFYMTLGAFLVLLSAILFLLIDHMPALKFFNNLRRFCYVRDVRILIATH